MTATSGPTVDLDASVAAARLSRLGIALLDRYFQVGSAGDPRAAVGLLATSVRVAGPRTPRRARRPARHHRDHARPGRGAARRTARAERGLAIGATLRAQFMIGLSAVWQDRYARTHELADLTAAIDVLGTVADAGAATTRDRERAARERGDLLAGHEDWAEAAAAYSAAVAMLHLLAWRGLDRGSQEWQLGRRLRSVGNATACAIAAGNPSGAVEALEHGRAVLWNQLLDSRADLTALTATRPEIARRLAEIRTALDEPAAHKARPTASRRERGRRQSQPRRVNMRWRIMQTPSVTRTTTG